MQPFLQPDYVGHPDLLGPAFSFLIEHPDRKPILFDLGTRKDWEKLTGYETFVKLDWHIHVDKNVAEILQETGIDVKGGCH